MIEILVNVAWISFILYFTNVAKEEDCKIKPTTFGYSEYIHIDYCDVHYSVMNLLISNLYRQNNSKEFLDNRSQRLLYRKSCNSWAGNSVWNNITYITGKFCLLSHLLCIWLRTQVRVQWSVSKRQWRRSVALKFRSASSPVLDFPTGRLQGYVTRGYYQQRRYCRLVRLTPSHF